MSLTSQIQVMRHFADGGRVESKAKRTTLWEFDRVPTWNFQDRHYRIEPRKFFLAISRSSNEIVATGTHFEDDSLAYARANPDEFEIIKVKEEPRDVKPNTATEPTTPAEHTEG